jgi:Tfp pilus assembly protein PilN
VINLIPDHYRKDIKAGRLNTVLSRYVILFGVIGILVVSSVAAGTYFVSMDKNRYQQQQTDIEAQNAALSDVKKQAMEFADNLKMAKTILSNSRSTTDFVSGIAATIPSGVVLTSLTIDNKTTTPATAVTPTIFSVQATNIDKITELKANMQKSSIFSKVNIQQVSIPTVTTPTKYPVTASVSVVIQAAEAKK